MSTSTQPSYVFRYFKVPGYGETSRLLLLASGCKWVEENPEWPQEKPNQPFGRLPVLVEKSEDGSPDFVLSESGTIERYLARRLGFLPSDPKKAALQEQLRDQIADVVGSYLPVAFSNYEDGKKKFEELLAKLKEVLPSALKNNRSSVDPEGGKITYIDLCVYGMLKSMINISDAKTPEYSSLFRDLCTPDVTKVIANVHAHPGLQAHVADDKKFFTVLA
ncbi:hypothetical protein H4S06_004558 [Coemansia sp. BCRC 34490]|nr:hypothetical protein H4S06_004558 [Coemansia sp. BCRC 34490]